MPLSKSWGQAFIGTGFVQLVLALLTVIFTFLIFADIPNLYIAPVYAGFLYLLPSALGIATGFTWKESYNHIIVIISMVLNIIMSVLMIVLAVLVALVSVLHRLNPDDIRGEQCEDTARGGCYCSRGFIYSFSVGCSKVNHIGNLLAVVAVLCGLCSCLSLAVSILGCAHTCCECCPSSNEDELANTVPMNTTMKTEGLPGATHQ